MVARARPGWPRGRYRGPEKAGGAAANHSRKTNQRPAAAYLNSYHRRVVVDAPPVVARPITGAWGPALLGVAGWAALVGVAIRWGSSLVVERPQMRISAAPFVGTWERLITDRDALDVAVVIGVVAVVAAPILFRRLPWRSAVFLAASLAVVWLLALNAVDGPDALRDPLTTRYEYVAGIPDVDAAGGGRAYLATFTDRISGYPTHVRGHPPGLVVGLWAAAEIGLDPVDVALASVLVGWGTAIAAALVATRDVAGEEAARRVAPVLALAPGAVWAGTSADPIFAGVTALAIAALVLATGRDGRRADALAATGGVLVGASLLLSYASVPVLLVPVAVALVRRRIRPLVIAAGTGTALLLISGLAGFWWTAGLLATREEYRAGLSQVRPYSYFVIGNLAAVAVATGPALAGGIANLTDRLVSGALAVGALVGVAAADLSGFSKGETERIWLVFVPWLATAAAFLPGRRDQVHRGWIAAQVVLGLGVQVSLRTPW